MVFNQLYRKPGYACWDSLTKNYRKPTNPKPILILSWILWPYLKYRIDPSRHGSKENNQDSSSQTNFKILTSNSKQLKMMTMRKPSKAKINSKIKENKKKLSHRRRIIKRKNREGIKWAKKYRYENSNRKWNWMIQFRESYKRSWKWERKLLIELLFLIFYLCNSFSIIT